jgi:hypothetical protein
MTPLFFRRPSLLCSLDVYGIVLLELFGMFCVELSGWW